MTRPAKQNLGRYREVLAFMGAGELHYLEVEQRTVGSWAVLVRRTAEHAEVVGLGVTRAEAILDAYEPGRTTTPTPKAS